jgi:hypothetical protein
MATKHTASVRRTRNLQQHTKPSEPWATIEGVVRLCESIGALMSPGDRIQARRRMVHSRSDRWLKKDKRATRRDWDAIAQDWSNVGGDVRWVINNHAAPRHRSQADAPAR